MSDSELFSILFSLLLLVGLAQALGYFFARLRQPKVIGEILAGIVLGPALFGRFPYVASLFKSADAGHTLGFVYWLGLLLLMFLSGAETRSATLASSMFRARIKRSAPSKTSMPLRQPAIASEYP